MTSDLKMPDAVEFMTADEVAETLDDVEEDAYFELWHVTKEAEKAGTSRPLGGDGTDGTREDPDVLTETHHANCMPTCWAGLSDETKRVVIDAVKKETP